MEVWSRYRRNRVVFRGIRVCHAVTRFLCVGERVERGVFRLATPCVAADEMFAIRVLPSSLAIVWSFVDGWVLPRGVLVYSLLAHGVCWLFSCTARHQAWLLLSLLL